MINFLKTISPVTEIKDFFCRPVELWKIALTAAVVVFLVRLLYNRTEKTLVGKALYAIIIAAILTACLSISAKDGGKNGKPDEKKVDETKNNPDETQVILPPPPPHREDYTFSFETVPLSNIPEVKGESITISVKDSGGKESKVKKTSTNTFKDDFPAFLNEVCPDAGKCYGKVTIMGKNIPTENIRTAINEFNQSRGGTSVTLSNENGEASAGMPDINKQGAKENNEQ